MLMRMENSGLKVCLLLVSVFVLSRLSLFEFVIEFVMFSIFRF